MLSRYTLLALAALCAGAPTAAQRLPHASWAQDPQTGEPVPFSAEAPPAYDATRPDRSGGGAELLLLDHWAEGSTKVARVQGDVVFYQNGALLLSARLEGDPLALTPLDTLALPGQPGDIALSGDRAYVGLRKGRGLSVVDISDPADLREVGRADGREGISVAVSGDVLYLGMGTAGVAVYDVSSDTPVFVRAFSTPGSANGFAVDGGYLHVADGNSADGPDFRIYSLADAQNPALVGTLEAGGFVTGVAASGGFAYLTGSFGLIIANVTDPSAPETLMMFDLGDTTYEVAFVDAPSYGSRIVVAGLGGVSILGPGIPSGPLLYSTYTDVQQALGVVVAGTTPLVSDRFQGLRALDVSDPAGAVQIAFARNGGFSARATFADSLLYVTDLAGALRIFDVTGDGFETAGARLLSVTDVPANAQEVEVRGDRAYVTDADFGGTGLTILDVSDPTAPVVLGGYASPNQAFGLDVVGTTVYLCNGFSGLVVLDASDPANVTELGSFPFGANATDVVVDAENEVAYVVSFGGGMRSLDVSDPANITELDAEAWGFLNAVAFEYETDITQPNTSTLYVADGQQGLRIVTATNPAELSTAQLTPVLSQARDVAGGIGFSLDIFVPDVYVADDFYGIRMPVYSPDGPSFESADRGFGVAVPKGPGCCLIGPVVLMSGETGVYFFRGATSIATDAGAEAAAVHLAAHPNPTLHTASVAFSLPEAGTTRLEAFDVLGRRVAVLQNGPLAAGEHERTLDASALPSGVYVLRLQTERGTATTRVTVLR